MIRIYVQIYSLKYLEMSLWGSHEVKECLLPDGPMKSDEVAFVMALFLGFLGWVCFHGHGDTPMAGWFILGKSH